MVRWRVQGKRLAAWLLALLLVATAGVVAYAGTPLQAEDARVDAVRENPNLVVEDRDAGLVLRDRDPDGDRVALVFYPGARVEPEAYLPTLAGLVERTDVRVYVPRLPLGFAILDPGRAADVRTGPDVAATYVGGHSLGGAMACRYAANNPRDVEGVVLLAAYCVDDLSTTDLAVLTVTGERDGVVNRERIEESRRLVPDDARFVTLAGFNHSSFAAYHGQPGDRPGTVNSDEASIRLTDVLAGFFQNRSGVASAG